MRVQMAKCSAVMTVVDVYDAAASIGKEFERIIDTFGAECVTELMPKVINVLEQLEDLANSNQKENAEISELKFAVERLTAEKIAKTEERHRYEQELEQIEDSWRKETRELVDTVARLQDDNRKLRSSVSNHQLATDAAHQAEHDVEVRLESELCELKDTMHRQRVEMRGQQREIASKTVDIEAMDRQLESEVRLRMKAQQQIEEVEQQMQSLIQHEQNDAEMASQLERMARLNAEYRRKTTLTQQRAQNLIQEKADLQANLHDKEQQIHSIKQQMTSDSLDSPGSPVSPSMSNDDVGRMAERLMVEGKLIIDLKDPDRPRFTLNELREVLTERNELKTKLIEVEEELQHYKPVEMTRQEEEVEDPPVQGPMPEEPYEKLYPGRKRESGIRKFFQFLLSPSKKSRKSRSVPLRGLPPPEI